MTYDLILYRWANGKPDRLCLLKDSLEKALQDILDNKGKELTSANISDASFTFDSSSYTAEQWASLLQRVIDMIENGTGYKSRRTARIIY